MAVIGETDETLLSGNGSSLNGEEQEDASTDEKHTQISGESSNLPEGSEKRHESGETARVPLDDGGGGDKQDGEKENAELSSKFETASQDQENYLEGSSIADNDVTKKECVLLDSSSHEGTEITALQVVSQILEELIEAVVAEVEVKFECSDEETVDTQEDQESPEETLRSKDQEGASLTTLKSMHEQYTIIDDEELQAQLALEEEVAALQRERHERNIAWYHTLTNMRAQLKLKNSFLLRQMYELYKAGKIEHLFRESTQGNADTEGKYLKLLLEYEKIRDEALDEEVKQQKQVHILEEKRININSILEGEFDNLLERERCIGRGLIYSQTAKPIPDKAIEKLIQRQIFKSQEVSKQRLTYFKLRDTVSADENLLQSLQTLGENLTLMEYEQLKMQSQSCVEKLEERDADLHRLRSKATSAIQVLAEIREKAQALLEEIEGGKVILHDVNYQLSQTRERLGCEKKRRDMIRSDAVRLRHEAGLLSEPKLLRDYKASAAEKDQLSANLKGLKHKFEQQKHTIAQLRQSIAALTQSSQDAH